jgi:hypothetical protein
MGHHMLPGAQPPVSASGLLPHHHLDIRSHAQTAQTSRTCAQPLKRMGSRTRDSLGGARCARADHIISAGHTAADGGK